MNRLDERFPQLRFGLIVSCQAWEGDAFHTPDAQARFARAAVAGGAVGIRANGPDDIRAIAAAVAVPVIGIQKTLHDDDRILITPSFEAAAELAAAGASMVALDCTGRGQRAQALERLARIRRELDVLVFADIATVEEAVAAVHAGADAVLSTLRGYTDETAAVRAFEPEFIRALRRSVDVPVIAEGRIWTPHEAASALDAGAWAVIVGTAITRPRDLTQRFAHAVRAAHPARENTCWIGIDMGGTNTKSGLVSPDGQLLRDFTSPTPVAGGASALLDHLGQTASACRAAARQLRLECLGIGIATAGWIDPGTGVVTYATDNLPGWTGADVAGSVHRVVELPVFVENDANALAVGEHQFGAARGVDDFMCLTLGTGVGGGCYSEGRLLRGAHCFANALGHISIVPKGQPCNCGQRGCLEAYASAAALVRYAGIGFRSAEEVIAAANQGHSAARAAVRDLATWLAQGCGIILQVLDASLIVISGGVAQNNPLLFETLEAELPARVSVFAQRRVRVVASPLGYHGGVLGAAAVAVSRSRISS